jgi:hypothetical protein
MSVAVGQTQFDYVQVIGRAVEVLRRNFALLITLTLVFYGLPKLGATLLDFSDSAPIVGPLLSATEGLYGVVAMLGYFAVQVMVVYVFARHLDGRAPTLDGALRHGLNLFVPVLCLVMVFATAVVLGLILLVIPGLMIATAWLVSVPALAVERVDVRTAIDRSIWLTRGYRWPVFGILAVMLLIRFSALNGGHDHLDAALPFGSPAMLEAAAGAARSLVEGVVDDVVDIVTTLVFALVVTSIYCELRMLKEGVAPQDLGAQLD